MPQCSQTKGDATTKNRLTSMQSEIERVDRELASTTIRPDDLYNRIKSPALRLESTVREFDAES